jgi:hypothetical protein
MPPDTAHVRRVLDEVAQALSIIAPVSTRLRLSLGHTNDDAIALEDAVGRAMVALTSLHPVLI